MGLYQYDSTEDKLNLVAGSTNFSDAPVGAIFPFGGTDIPISFLLCDGSAVSRTDYAELFEVIGTSFGEGDGSTTFNIPDLREATTKGVGLTGLSNNHYDADGLAVGEFIDDRVQVHQHQLNIVGSSSHIGQSVSDGTHANYKSGGATVANELRAKDIPEGRSGATTEVKSVGVNYLIKARQIGMPTDFASAVGDIVVDKNTYATNETIVGKWIDGKPIYRKVFTSLTTITTGWSNLVDKGDVETITHADYAISTSGVRNGFMQVRVYEDYVQVSTSAQNSGVVGIYLEYTKTTD